MTRVVPLVLVGCAAVVTAGVLTGCVTEVKEDDRASRGVSVRSPSSPTAAAARTKVPAPAGRAPQAQPSAPVVPVGPEALDQLTANEPCANRLHALAGDMLLYYAVHRRLPAELDDLKTISDSGAVLNFTCPTSGQPYVYVPTGLVYPGKDERLVLYDAEPTHDGARWGIVAAPPKGERPAATWAAKLSEGVFQAYAAPPAPKPAPVAEQAAPVEPRARRPRTPKPLN